MVVDWLAAGIDPDKATIFIQSRLPEHAELFTLLAMGTPLSWLERFRPTRTQIEKLKDRDLATYGFLGYPLLQAADILIYKAGFVPWARTRRRTSRSRVEVARRFNHLYGREPDFEAKAQETVEEAGKADAKVLKQRARLSRRPAASRTRAARDLIARVAVLSVAERDRLEPGCAARQDDPAGARGAAHRGQQAARPRRREDEQELQHTIAMREDPAEVERKIKRMPTDPQRVRRTDPATRNVAQCGNSTRSTAMPRRRSGRQGLHHRRASAVSSASSR